MMQKHIVIFRTSGSYINYSTYNCQEVGLAKALAKKGYRVSVLMGGPESKHVELGCGNSGIGIYYLIYKGINQSICVFSGWEKLLEQLRPDVLQVHEFGMFMSWCAARWAKRNDVKCVLVQGNYEATRKPVLKQLECAFNFTFGKSTLGLVSAIGCKTKAAAEYLLRYGKVSCQLTPVGLDEDKFVNCPQGGDIKKEYGIEGKKMLLYVGALEPRRNPMFLLQVLQRLPGDYALMIVGDGPQRKEVAGYVAAQGVANVVMTGKLKQEQLPAIYHAADAFLLASNYEIFGMVILEAMYFGCPVISTATAGAVTIIEATTGVVMPGMDIELWKNCIMDICDNEKRLRSMKERCKAAVRNEYVWNKASDKFVGLYGLVP